MISERHVASLERIGMPAIRAIPYHELRKLLDGLACPDCGARRIVAWTGLICADCDSRIEPFLWFAQRLGYGGPIDSTLAVRRLLWRAAPWTCNRYFRPAWFKRKETT
jgi:hypothetical protein